MVAISNTNWTYLSVVNPSNTNAGLGGFIYVSGDYGITWGNTGIFDYFTDVAINSSGQYMIASYSRSGALGNRGGVWISSNYGGFFTDIATLTYNQAGITAVSVNSDGSRYVAIASSQQDACYWTSINGGTQWTATDGLTSDNNYAGAVTIIEDTSANNYMVSIWRQLGTNTLSMIGCGLIDGTSYGYPAISGASWGLTISSSRSGQNFVLVGGPSPEKAYDATARLRYSFEPVGDFANSTTVTMLDWSPSASCGITWGASEYVVGCAVSKTGKYSLLLTSDRRVFYAVSNLVSFNPGTYRQIGSTNDLLGTPASISWACPEENVIINGTTITYIRFIVLTTSDMYYYSSNNFTDTQEVINNNFKINGICYANNFYALSDYRIKTNVTPLLPNSIDNLNPVYYNNVLTKRYDMGFIAHELQKEFPFLVFGEKDDDEYQSVNYIGIIALLVKELKDIKREMRDLKNKMEKN